MLQIESESRSVEDQVMSVVTSRDGNGVKQSSLDQMQSFSTLGISEIAPSMNVDCLWGLSSLGQDGVKIPIGFLHSAKMDETVVGSQLVISAGISIRKHKLSVAANSIKAMSSIKQRRTQDKVNRQHERSVCRHRSLVISELLKVIPTYPVEEVKTNAFASKQEDIAEVSVETPVSTTNADNLATPGTSDEIYMDVDIPSNSPNARIRKRKLHRKVLKNMKAAVMSTHVIANVNKDKVSKLLAQAIRLQDPPDRKETFVEMDLNSDQFNRRVGIFKDFQDVIVPDDSHIPMGQSNIPEYNDEFVPGGEEKLQNSHPKPFPARGIKRELMDNAFRTLEVNGGGTNNDLEAKCCFASPAFLAAHKCTKALRLCITLNLL